VVFRGRAHVIGKPRIALSLYSRSSFALESP
jgi:hypothetical protein